ncbi:MAG TPA: hypothetical protein ENN45_04150 [Bacteroidetes bacterium]|nr:hypothetical protein [Bacteroidota bacterium]
MKAVESMVKELKLENVRVLNTRSTELKDKFDFVVARAVTNFPKFLADVKHLIKSAIITNQPNGIIYLKGGDFSEEIRPYKNKVNIEHLKDYFSQEYFETKKIIHYKF